MEVVSFKTVTMHFIWCSRLSHSHDNRESTRSSNAHLRSMSYEDRQHNQKDQSTDDEPRDRMGKI